MQTSPRWTECNPAREYPAALRVFLIHLFLIFYFIFYKKKKSQKTKQNKKTNPLKCLGDKNKNKKNTPKWQENKWEKLPRCEKECMLDSVWDGNIHGYGFSMPTI